MYIGKVPVILVKFERNLYFIDRFSENNQISHFTKIRPVGAVFYADEKTDIHDVANSRFAQLSNETENRAIAQRHFDVCFSD